MIKADTTLFAQTPEGIEYTLYPAGLVIRAAAFAVDFIFKWLIIIAAELVLVYFQHAIGQWFLLLIMFVVEWLYHFISEVFFCGQSLGKKFLGLRVVRNDGSIVDAEASFIRNLLRFADTFLSLYHIAIIVICTSRAFRRIGDLAAGTLVVYTSAAMMPRRNSCALNIDAVHPPRDLSFEEKQALSALASRYDLLGEKRASEIVSPWLKSFAPSGGSGSDSAGASVGGGAEYALRIAKNWI